MNETSPATSPTHSPITHEDISRRAQDLWEKYGRPSGRDEEIWLEAERNLRAEQSTPAATSSAATASLGAGASVSEASPAAEPARTARPPSGATAMPKMPGTRSKKR